MQILGLSAFYHDSAAALVRDGDIIELGPDDKVLVGDKVALLAPPAIHAEMCAMPDFTPGILDQKVLDSYITTNDIVVNRELVVGQPLRALRVTDEFGCFVTNIRRAQIELPVDLRDTGDDQTLRKCE